MNSALLQLTSSQPVTLNSAQGQIGRLANSTDLPNWFCPSSERPQPIVTLGQPSSLRDIVSPQSPSCHRQSTTQPARQHNHYHAQRHLIFGRPHTTTLASATAIGPLPRPRLLPQAAYINANCGAAQPVSTVVVRYTFSCTCVLCF